MIVKVHNRIEIEFAGVTLPVIADADGRDCIPLKPICDALGVKWEDQRVKFGGTCAPDNRGAGRRKSESADAYLARRLGICNLRPLYAGQTREMVCIRVDRVIGFLLQINPDKVRAAGNAIAADFLEEKHQEWDGVLHEYESRKGGMLQAATVEARTKAVNVRLFVSVMRAKQATEVIEDRRALSEVAAGLAGDLGISYQLELTN